ncbi:MAG: hypothetical protein WA790_11690 [Sulfitobacter sp.]
MKEQTDFATRITRINKSAAKIERKRKRKPSTGLCGLFVMPLVTATFVAGGVVFYWEALERPTSTPLQLASDLTAQLLAYLV